MSITFTIKIEQLICVPNYNGKENVVTTVNWSYTGIDQNKIKARQNGSTDVVYGGGTFTPFEQLTENEVLGWLSGKITEEEKSTMEIAIAANIALVIEQSSANDPVMVIPPWRGGS